MNQLVLIVDFGGQYRELIARRVRENNVFCRVVGHKITIEEIKELAPIGIIFSGGPNSVYEQGAPTVQKELFSLGIPILGICYGAQLMASVLGGEVVSPEHREYGNISTKITADSKLFDGVPTQLDTWMSHTDYISKMPEGFIVTATTDACPAAAVENAEKKLYGLQFHPEVEHTNFGREILRGFLYNVCCAKGDWSMQNYKDIAIQNIKDTVGDGKVLLGLSGGVDSSVVASLISKAIGKNLTCIFVDHGLMRKNEGDEIEEVFGDGELNFVRVNAADRFLGRLKGVTDPEQKRKIIGEEFIRVFEAESKKLGKIEYLAQGTIYPDVVESGEGESAVIKSHHNVGGLPEDIGFDGIIEPLRMLFKDEVRTLGTELGLPDHLVWRQPFPGPGLAIRVIGEITDEKLETLREADAIFREEIATAGLERSVNQYFAVLTDTRSVGVMGDVRTYNHTLALRGVTTTDFMTAKWAKIPYETLETTSNRILNEVRGIGRVVYDVTSKPPGTIEWE